MTTSEIQAPSNENTSVLSKSPEQIALEKTKQEEIQKEDLTAKDIQAMNLDGFVEGEFTEENEEDITQDSQDIEIENNEEVVQEEIIENTEELQNIENNEISQDEQILKYLNENSQYTDKEKSAAVGIVKDIMKEFEMSWEDLTMDNESFLMLLDEKFGEIKTNKEKVEVKEEKTEVKEQETVVKEQESETKSYQETFDELYKQYEGKPTTELIKALLSVPKIPEATRKQFSEYQKLLSFTETNEAFKGEDKAIVEKAVRSGLQSGENIQTTVQKLYESPNLNDEAKTALAEQYGMPELKLKPMKTETDVEEMAKHMDRVKEKTEIAITEKKKAVKQISEWKENVEEQTEELENEILDIENRVMDLEQRKESGEILTDEEEQELAEKKELLGLKQEEKEKLEQQKKQLEEQEKSLKEDQRALEKQYESLTDENGNTKFKLRMHDVFVTEGGKYNNINFKNIPGTSKFLIEENALGFKQDYGKMTIYDALGGENGASGKLFPGVRLDQNKTLSGQDLKLGSTPVTADSFLQSIGLKQNPGEIMSAQHQQKLYKVGECFDGPGGADESLRRLGVINSDGSFNASGWEKVHTYLKENINHENNLTFDAMSKALNKTEDENNS